MFSKQPEFDSHGPFARSVLHLNDFTGGSDAAFLHALALTVAVRGHLTLLHAGEASRNGGTFPSVRETLERWGRLPPGSTQADVHAALQIKVKKVKARRSDPVAATMAYLDSHPTDLIVLTTGAREGLARWIQPSVAERLARRSAAITLFVPVRSTGFVNPDTGAIDLRRILLPVDRRPRPQFAVDHAARLVGLFSGDGVAIDVLHVGDPARSPRCELPETPGATWARVSRQGEVVDEIVAAVVEADADLIVMATKGHVGILDAIRGSVTEQVLRRSGCPLLAVPSV